MNYYAIDRKFMQDERAIYVPISVVDEQDWPPSDIDALKNMLSLLEDQSPDGLGIPLGPCRMLRIARQSDVSELWGYMLLTKAVLLSLITLMPSATFISTQIPQGRLHYTVAARRRAGVL